MHGSDRIRKYDTTKGGKHEISCKIDDVLNFGTVWNTKAAN